MCHPAWCTIVGRSEMWVMASMHTDTPCTLIHVMHFFDKKHKKVKINIEIKNLLATGQKPHGQCLIHAWCV